MMVNKLGFVAILMLNYSVSVAQHSLEKIWESDSVTLNGPESVLFDAKSSSLYVSSMNAGTVVRMDLNGKVIKNEWVAGLKSNKGSALFNGLFFTAETSGVAVIDVKTATVIKRIPIDGAVMLNDVAVDSKGIVYVTDTRTGKVYRIKDDKPELYLENMAGANGLFTFRTDVYLVTSTDFLKVNASKQITRIADGFESGLDGIVMVEENEFLLSNYKGILYYVKVDGTKEILLDSRANRIMSNDIGYDKKTRTVYVPSFATNRVIAYKLK